MVRLRFNESDYKEQSFELHGELPKAGSIIEIDRRAFAVSAEAITWLIQGGELIPVLRLLLKTDDVPA